MADGNLEAAIERIRKSAPSAAFMDMGRQMLHADALAVVEELDRLRSLTRGLGELPEGCPETLEYFTRTQSLFINVEDYDPANPEPSVVVEIHPVGTRAALTALTGQAKKGEG